MNAEYRRDEPCGLQSAAPRKEPKLTIRNFVVFEAPVLLGMELSCEFGRHLKVNPRKGVILGANTLTTSSPPRGLDHGTTSISGGSRGGTVCFTMQNPQPPVFSGTPGRGVDQGWADSWSDQDVQDINIIEILKFKGQMYAYWESCSAPLSPLLLYPDVTTSFGLRELRFFS
eukprot:1159135-Pelagomonas_calceolata.AAC.8